jgi:segregation and condensation protein A
VEELVDQVPRTGTITFHQLTGSLAARLEVIVRFLAVLELYKRGWVDLAQATTFGELTIVWTGMDDDEAASAAAFPIEEYQG